MNHVFYLYILAGPWRLFSFASKNKVEREISKYLKVLCWLSFLFVSIFPLGLECFWKDIE